MHAASALIGVAIANRLPQFSINGDIGRQGTALANLLSANPQFFFYTGLASASQTIFDGFTLQQRQRAAEAGFDQVAAQYRMAVLTAFQNVADALYAIRHDTVGLQKALLAEAAAKKSLDLTRVQLAEGQVAFQQLLAAQTTYLQASLDRHSGAGEPLQRYGGAVPGAGRRLVEQAGRAACAAAPGLARKRNERSAEPCCSGVSRSDAK